jgi:hypothetical protein
MTIALIIAAVIAGLLAYAAIGFYVAGLVERRCEDRFSDEIWGFVAGLTWPIGLPIAAIWWVARPVLERIYEHSKSDPAERRERRIADRKAKASRVALARAIVRPK